MGLLSTIKKGTDNHINKISGIHDQYETHKKCNLWNCLSSYNSIVGVIGKAAPEII